MRINQRVGDDQHVQVNRLGCFQIRVVLHWCPFCRHYWPQATHISNGFVWCRGPCRDLVTSSRISNILYIFRNVDSRLTNRKKPSACIIDGSIESRSSKARTMNRCISWFHLLYPIKRNLDNTSAEVATWKKNKRTSQADTTTILRVYYHKNIIICDICVQSTYIHIHIYIYTYVLYMYTYRYILKKDMVSIPPSIHLLLKRSKKFLTELWAVMLALATPSADHFL